MEFRLVPVNQNALFSKYLGQHQLQKCEITVDTRAMLTLHDPFGHFSAASRHSLAFYFVIFIHNWIEKTHAMKKTDNMQPHFIISSGN